MRPDIDDVLKMAGYLATHRKAGHDDPAHPKYPKYVKDLGTLLLDARRVLYRIVPPATAHEQLSYITHTVAAIDRRTETFVSELGDQIAAAAAGTKQAANDAANRVIDLINSDRSEIDALKAKATEDAALIAALQAQIDAGTITPEAAQAVVDTLAETNAKLADLDSDPLTPV